MILMITFDLAGGIALFYFNSHGDVLIDSCSILNNTKGMVLFDLVADYTIGITVNIRNTQYFNHQESTIVVFKEYHSSLQLFNVNTTDQLVIYLESNEIYSYKELKNGYALHVSSLYLAIQYSDNIKNNITLFRFGKEYCYSDFEINKKCDDSSKCELLLSKS